MSREPPLHCALERGYSDTDIVKLLEKLGDRIDARSRLGMTVLHRAVNLGRSTIVEELLNRGAQINAGSIKTSKRGYTALHYAAAKEDKEMVMLLLRKGAQIDSTAVDKKTPLYVATERSCDEIVELLLKKGANVDIRDKNGKAILHVAVEKADFPTVKHILDFRPNVNSDANRSSLYAAVKSLNGVIMQDEKIVEALLHYGFTFRAEDAKDAVLLHESVENGHVKVVEALLKLGADVNTLHSAKKGVTLLHSATMYRRLEMAKLLLSQGANVNAKDDLQKSAIYYAIKNSDANINSTAIKKERPQWGWTKCDRVTILALLLEKGANVESPDQNGKTVLDVAVENADLRIVEKILDFHPSVNSVSSPGSLYAAVKGPNAKITQKIVEALLRHGIPVCAKDTKNAILLHASVELGYVKIVEALLKFGADVNTLRPSTKKGVTLLHSAVMLRQLEIAKLLLSHGANADAKDGSQRSAIFYAIDNNDADMIKLLLSGDTSVKVTTELLHTTVKNKMHKIVELLLQLAPNIDVNACGKFGITALHYTALNDGWDLSQKFVMPSRQLRYMNFSGHHESMDACAEMAKSLLARGALVNAKMENGITAIHAAALSRNAKVVKVLLANKADVNSLAKCRMTPLHAAAHEDNLDTIELLLESGANVNARQTYGTTALHIASAHGHIGVLKFLVERDADIDAKDKNELTPLHKAAINGDFCVVSTLLNLGASIEAKDLLGRTALHFAAKYGRLHVTYILLDQGADINATCEDSMTPLDYATLEENMSFNDPDPDPDDAYDLLEHYTFLQNRRHEGVAESLERHIVTMKALEVYVSESNMRTIDLQYKHRSFLESCQMEVAKMKNKTIGDSNVSVYDVATRCVNRLAVYARNESIVQAFNPQDYDSEFRVYSKMIERRFNEGQKRGSLLSSSLKSLPALSGYILPDLIAVELLNYLSNRDLENLIKLTNPQNPRGQNIDLTRCEKSQRVKGNKKQKTDS